jgi:hypothetical protein
MELSLVEDEKLLVDGIEIPVNKVVHAKWIEDENFQESLIELVESKIKDVEGGLRSGKYSFAKLQVSHYISDLGEMMNTERSDIMGYALINNSFIKSLNLGQKEVLSLSTIDEFQGILWHNIKDTKVYETGLKDLVEKIISFFTFDFAKIQRKIGPFGVEKMDIEGDNYNYYIIIALRPNVTEHFNLTQDDWKPLMGLKYGRYQSYLTETFAICEDEEVKVSNQTYEILDLSDLFNEDGSVKGKDVILKYFGTSLKNVVPMLRRTIARRRERSKLSKAS